MTGARPLILAPHSDPHACALAWAIEQQGIEPLWFAALATTPGSHYRFHIDAETESLRAPFDLSGGVTAVWNRRFQEPKPHCAEQDRTFAAWEWKMFQRSIFSLDSTFARPLWVNPVDAARHAENKLVQLSVCRRLGIPFPETVVTTDAAEVDALRRRWGRIVFKSFLVHQWEERDSGRMHAVGVTLLDGDSELPAEAIAVCPGIYQRYVEKACDVRVTVIGERMFALAIRKVQGGGFVDWRTHAGDPDLRAEGIALPEGLETRLKAFMRELGLVFGCIDLVMDTDGEFHFLEVNQAGQFLFVEDMLPGCPILRATTAMLVTGRVDYALDDVNDVSMKGFWASDRFERLREAVDETPPERILFTVE
jgi:hypothetical protein